MEELKIIDPNRTEEQKKGYFRDIERQIARQERTEQVKKNKKMVVYYSVFAGMILAGTLQSVKLQKENAFNKEVLSTYEIINKEYEIEKGDTITSIIRENYNEFPEEVKDAVPLAQYEHLFSTENEGNYVNPNHIEKGQVLNVPYYSKIDNELEENKSNSK